MSSDDRFSPNDAYSTRPPKKASGGIGIWGIGGCVVAVVGSLALLGVFCCGGVVMFGMNEFGKQVIASVKDDEIFQAEIGDDATASINWSSSFTAEDDDEFTFDVSGSNGSGQVTVLDGDEYIRSAILKKDGQEWELDVTEVDILGGAQGE